MRTSTVRRLMAAALAVVGLAAVTGCDLAGASNAPPQPKKGGTLYINLQGGLDILDPQRTYSAAEMNVLRLTTRTLTTYRTVPGPTASEIVPDLATDTGRPSDNNTVWTFTLKPNLKWEGGEPVTCSQVKYGIERRFAKIMDEGAAYPLEYLQDNATPYEGPFVGGNNDGKGLESIKCTDERNIVFRLKRPVGDFGYTVALSTFAPVPPEKDTKDAYAKRPYSNGPYKVEGKLTEDGLTLVRNKFWTETNDQIRKAYPDKIVFDFRPDTGGVITNEIIENQGDARDTVMLDGNVAPNFLQQVINDSDLINRSLIGPTGGVRYLAISTKEVPNPICRQALIYAFNKRKWRAVNGGSVTGDYATTMIPPDVRAHKDFDLFDSIANPEGNPEKAMDLMDSQKGDKACPTKVRVAFPDGPLRKRLMNTVVEAYQLAGIEAQLFPLDPATYYNTGIGDPTNNYHMMLAGWIPDWANGSAIIPPIYHGRVIPKVNPLTGKAAGNVNFSLVNDPKFNEQIDVALMETSPERQYALWGDLDQQIQQLAVTIPILYEKAIRLAGSNVLGGFIHPAFGMPDLCALGLAQP
ncbi:MAG TPA: ABC transporter substrate-binding protein [Micromonosporaceae bacterium]